MKSYDIIVIGGGAAGLSAAIYAARRAMQTLVLTEDIGGQATMTPHIENYPGLAPMTGNQVMQTFYSQAKEFGAAFVFEKVTKIEKQGEGFLVKTSTNTFETKSIVLACGMSHRALGVAGEESLYGKGISFCATCDGPLFKNKMVGVVGEANMAIEAADYLSDIASGVYLIQYNDAVLKNSSLGKGLMQKKNVTIFSQTKVIGFEGTNKLQGVILETKEGKKGIGLDGLFIKIALLPKTQWLKDLVTVDAGGHIVTDDMNRTNVPGIFACGDVTKTIFKQIVIAAGEGAKAALMASKFVKGQTDDSIILDWTRS